MNYEERNQGRDILLTIAREGAGLLSKGWDLIAAPTKSRCDAYISQSIYAQEQMQKTDISRRERRYWSKQNDKAMNGLAEVHNKNCDTFVSVIVAIGAGLLIGNSLLKK